MNALSKRLARLESRRAGPLNVIGSAPASWPPEVRESAVRELAAQSGITGPFSTFILEERDPAVQEAALIHVGDFAELMKEISRTGRRLGGRVATQENEDD